MKLAAAAPYLIEPKYQDYTAEQQAVWAELVRRGRPQIEAFACEEYWEGSAIIGLESDRLPDLAAITGILEPRTGWSTTAVSGLLPSDTFFEMLNAGSFPSRPTSGAALLSNAFQSRIFFTMFSATSPCTPTKCLPIPCNTMAPYAQE
jgi:hypothetical protein